MSALQPALKKIATAARASFHFSSHAISFSRSVSRSGQSPLVPRSDPTTADTPLACSILLTDLGAERNGTLSR
jgi:hypothetical protein